MARTRCGDWASSSLKLKWPCASAFVRPASSMPWASLRRTTSSPAAGLLVVEFLTVPVRVWEEASEARRRMAAADAARTNAKKDCEGNSLRGRVAPLRDKGSFDCVGTSLREVSTPLRMTVLFSMTALRYISFKIGFLFEVRGFSPGGRFRPEGWRLRPAGKISER